MGTVTVGASSGTTLTVASLTGTFAAGEPVVVSDGSGHAQTFIASGTQTSTTITVTAAQNWNYAYTTSATVTGPKFNGASAPSLCSALKLSIVETSSGQALDLSGADVCSYSVTSANPAATNACDLSGGKPLSSLPTTSTALTLANAVDGNAATGLDAGKSRYFLIAVHYTGSTFDNTYQNWKGSSFDLSWNIDQA